MPVQTINVAEFANGPAVITYGGVDLGATAGGVKIKLETDMAENKIDQFGNTPVGMWTRGQTVQVTTTLRQITPAKLHALIPGSTLSGGVLYVGSTVGQQQAGQALVIRPFDDTQSVNMITIHKAVPKISKDIEYVLDKPVDYDVTFVGMADLSKDSGKELYQLEQASASAPTVTTSTPADDATNVSITAAFSVTFSEEVFPPLGDLAKHFLLYDATNDEIVPLTAVTKSGAVITITHGSLENSAEHALMVWGLTNTAGIPMANTKIHFLTVSGG